MSKRLHVKYSLFLSDFNEMSCSMQTDGHEANSRFSQLCERA
jgi:hypothetical protein